MALEFPSTFRDSSWKPGAAGARDPEPFSYASVEKRQSIKLLDWGSGVERGHNGPNFLLQFLIYFGLLQKTMEADR